MTMSNTPPKQPEKPNASQQPVVRKPNESGTVTVQAHMKIFDPQTKQIYVEGRA